MKRKIQDALFDLGNYISTRIPTSLMRPIAMPFTYQARVGDGFVYENANMINTAFGYCSNNKISGNYAEFGVFKGRTTIEAWKASHRHGLQDMQFWLFDSFQGLPEIGGLDIGGPFETAEFSYGRKDFENNLRKSGFPVSRTNIIEGYFDETLPNSHTDQQFSVVWIDCDLYESTVPVLKWLTGKLVDGAVLCFDDWFSFNGRSDMGEQKAVSEWLETNPDIKLMPYRDFHWCGKSFLHHKS